MESDTDEATLRESVPLKSFLAAYVQQVVVACDGDLSRAAVILDITVAQVRRWLDARSDAT